MENELVLHLHLVHTTPMGEERIRRNLCLQEEDPVAWCKEKILAPNSVITRRGKNWYVETADAVITVNAHSYTIITAHGRGN